MARMPRVVLRVTLALVAASLFAGAPAAALAAPLDTSPPASPVKLIFIHHSTGEAWLGNGLGAGLRDANYFVSDTNYGWGPRAIGDRTDVGDWWTWFRGPDSGSYTTALYGEYGQHAGYPRLATDPGGTNQIVMFKSCFPNSSVGGSPLDVVPLIGANPLRGAGMSGLTVGNAKGIYLDFLEYAKLHPERLFVLVVSPPLRSEDTNATNAANARALADWLVDPAGWLASYPLHNVLAFDYYTVLTGGHHRVVAGALEHTAGPSNYLAYPTGDSHPSTEGHNRAAADFVPLLNASYNAWRTEATQTPLPKATVYTPRAPSTMSHSKYYTIYGYLKPWHASGSYPIRIYKYRYVSGHWKSYGYTLAKATNRYDYSKYSRSIKLPYHGRWRLRAYAPADSGHIATWSSGYDYVTVK
jgi:hypothetical protein